ncbi:hypothetical protein D9C73_015682 [Collichthys lucidus]|uniref:Uncharacterized protein n=1 Tax=Collichthys lucidus TaxID=240159 RepID=A0A4U5V1H3_COLLU|nr:hypothetical protein D9C73_015682 [Collichthys lucidus]
MNKRVRKQKEMEECADPEGQDQSRILGGQPRGQTPASQAAKDQRQDVPKQQIRRHSGEGAEIRTEQGGQQTQNQEDQEPATSSLFSPQQVESPPVPTGDTQPPPPQTPPSPELSPFSLDDSPLLDFTDRMKSLVNMGIQLTPRQNPLFSPLTLPHYPAPPIPPRKQPSTKSHQAPPPPLNQHICESD